MQRALQVALVLLVGCGSSWQPVDTAYATDHAAINTQIMLACDTDAATCSAAAVYELSRASYCGDLATLTRHRLAVPEAGVKCQP